MSITEMQILEILLIAVGLVSFFIVYQYCSDKESSKYKLSLLIGFIAGAAIIAITALYYESWAIEDVGLVIVAGFALVMRPFRKTELAIAAAVVAIIAAYIYAGTLTGDFSALSEGTPRIITAVVAGAFVYMVLNFIEKLADILGLILNIWPILLIIGLVCIVNGVMIAVTGTSIFEYLPKQ